MSVQSSSRSGACPRCGVSVALATPTPTRVTCPACEQRCLVLLDEAVDTVPGEVHRATLLAERDEDGLLDALTPDFEAVPDESALGAEPDPRARGALFAALIALAAFGAVCLLLFAGYVAIALMQEATAPNPGTIAAVGLALLAVLVLSIAAGTVRLVARRRA